jgi:hypothetical protein
MKKQLKPNVWDRALLKSAMFYRQDAKRAKGAKFFKFSWRSWPNSANLAVRFSTLRRP